MLSKQEIGRVSQMIKIVTTGNHWVLSYRDEQWSIRLAGERQPILAKLPEFPTLPKVIEALMAVFGTGIQLSPEQSLNLVRALNQLVWTTSSIQAERQALPPEPSAGD